MQLSHFKSVSCVLRALLVVLLGLGPTLASAKVMLLTDFDGTLTRDRGEGAAWITPWVLQRVERLRNVYQQAGTTSVSVTLTDANQILYYNMVNHTEHPTNQGPVRVQLKLPDQLTISYDDFHRIEGLIAAGEGELRSQLPVMLTFDPVFPDRQLLIIPGYYRIFDQTFKYFRDSTSNTRPTNYLKANLREARVRAQTLGDGASFKGLAWPLFEGFMSSPDLVENVILSTARGERAASWNGFFDQLARDGDIKYSKSRKGRYPNVLTHNRPESIIYGGSLSEQKGNAVRFAVDSLIHSAGDRHWELNEAGVPELTHTLIVPEDDASHVDTDTRALLDLSGGLLAHKVKLVFFNASASEAEVKNSQFKQRWTVFLPGRRFRPATAQEIANYHDPLWLASGGTQSSCEGRLSVAGGAL